MLVQADDFGADEGAGGELSPYGDVMYVNARGLPAFAPFEPMPWPDMPSADLLAEAGLTIESLAEMESRLDAAHEAFVQKELDKRK